MYEPSSAEADRDGTEHEDTMTKTPHRGAGGTSLGGSVPSDPSSRTTVEVSTEHPLTFLTGQQVRAVEADPVLTVTDVYGGGER